MKLIKIHIWGGGEGGMEMLDLSFFLVYFKNQLKILFFYGLEYFLF